MVKVFRIILVVACLAGSSVSFAQVTTGSPYSQYGLGNLKGVYLPQYKAMGGIGVGLHTLGSIYNNINPMNPASYGGIRATAFDVGATGSVFQLSKANVSQQSFNATLSHVMFAVPVNKVSAFSFGLVPYSDLGYKFRTESKIDTNVVNYIYDGDGGMSKAYFGYGIMAGKHLSFGFNAGYLFGRLDKNSSTILSKDYAALNTRTEISNSVGGLNLDFGMQYFTDLSSKLKFSFGYVFSAGNKLGSREDVIVTHFKSVPDPGNPQAPDDYTSATDTLYYTQGGKVRITLPATHTVGFAFERTNKWLLGADVSMTQWSDYRVGNTNPNLQNSVRMSVGGQITPNINSVSNIFKLIDYRLGFKYEKTYININNTDIKQKALTLGLGIPLMANRSAFYKINFSSEFGQRGTLSNNLVRERFVNFNIGFLLNDRWFYRVKLD